MYYFNVFSREDAHLRDKLRQMNFRTAAEQSASGGGSWNWLLRWLLDAVRRFVGAIEGSYLLIGLFVAAGMVLYTQQQQQQRVGQST